MRRGSPILVIGLTAALILLGVLAWSAGQGTPLVSSPQGTWGEPRATGGWLPDLPELTQPPPGPTGELEGPSRATDSGLDLISMIMAAVVIGALLLLARWLLKQRLEEKEQDDPLAHDDELVALLDATSDEVRYRALSEGDPRNGVVACWVALEDAVQRSGLERNDSETAAELTTRVLRRWEVDEEAIVSLSEAYREARFSRHPVTDSQRDRAVAALETIHADLRRRVQAESEAAAKAQAEAEAADGPTSSERPA